MTVHRFAVNAQFARNLALGIAPFSQSPNRFYGSHGNFVCHDYLPACLALQARIVTALSSHEVVHFDSTPGDTL